MTTKLQIDALDRQIEAVKAQRAAHGGDSDLEEFWALNEQLNTLCVERVRIIKGRKEDA